MPNSWKRHPLLFGGLLLALIAVALYGFRRAQGVPVEVAYTTRGPLVQTVVTTGRVRPQLLRVSALTTGRIAGLHGREGQVVEAGELLFELDRREAEARVQEAAAALERAQADRRSVGSVQLKQAQEVLTQAEARAAEAHADLGRLQHLSTSGAVTKKALEQARTTQQLTESALREARVQRAAVRRGGARMRSAEASVRQAEAAVALAQAHLDSCRIVAPAAGVIIAREAEVGDVVGPTTTVLQLAARSRTELIAELDERNLSALAIGQRALASAEAFPEQTFAAVVHFIAPAVDAQRGTVEVRLLVQAPPSYLRPDMTVSIDIEVASEQAATTLPLSAIRDLARDPYVLLLQNGHAQRRPVKVGIRDERQVKLLGPLPLDVPVIVDANIQAGDRVRARDAAE